MKQLNFTLQFNDSVADAKERALQQHDYHAFKVASSAPYLRTYPPLTPSPTQADIASAASGNRRRAAATLSPSSNGGQSSLSPSRPSLNFSSSAGGSIARREARVSPPGSFSGRHASPGQQRDEEGDVQHSPVFGAQNIRSSLGDARDRFDERTGPRSFSSSRLLSPLRGDASGFLSDAPAPRTKSRLVTTDFINAG
jgi:hypothetical protein